MSLNIDITLVIQLVFFLIFIFLLNHFLFKPFLKLLEDRRSKTEGALKEAESLDKEALKMLEEYEKRVQEAKVKAQEHRMRLRQESLKREREIVEKAREEASSFLEEVSSNLNRQAKEILDYFNRESGSIVSEIVERTLGRRVV